MENCIYCGCLSLRPKQLEDETICESCSQSKGDRTAYEWLFWLKLNEPDRWQQMVEYHRLGSDRIADHIRRLRIER
jgi:hypothetical protein